jgi:hypothetical protein
MHEYYLTDCECWRRDESEPLKHSGLKVDGGSVLPKPFHIWRTIMDGAVMTLARWQARQIIKRELRGQGIQLSLVEPCDITIAANQYIADHPEIVAFATEQYRSFVESGYLKSPRNRRKPSQ